MLSGQAVIAIWNGIADEGRAEFYAWHVTEHMPERIAIPGFLRGRRYRALDAATHPEYFTLYELEAFEVATSKAYLDRLNAPTPWTKKATAAFRDTSRGLARVLTSVGPGPGGALATVRFHVDAGGEQEARATAQQLTTEISASPLITGVHFGVCDADASGAKTAETKGRTDIQQPPSWFALIEACAPEALEDPLRRISDASAFTSQAHGRYVFEYARLKS